MTFKKWKYNLLVIGLIALIGCYIGMSLFIFNDTNLGVQQGGTGEVTLPDDDVEPPVMDDEDDENGEEVILPTDPLKLVNYGLNLIATGKGYQSSFSQTMTNTAVGVSVVQSVNGTISKGVNSNGETVSVENFYFHSDASGLAASMVANYYRGIYVNYDTNEAQIAFTPAYNWEQQTYDLSQANRNDLTTKDSVLEEFGVIQGEGFPIALTSANASVTRDNKESSKVYRYITIKVKPAYLSTGYQNYWLSNGQLSNLSYGSEGVEITFTIHKETGAITQINRSEAFTANTDYNGMTVSVTSQVTTTQKFSTINKTVQLADSL